MVERVEDLDFCEVALGRSVARGQVGRYEAVDVRVEDHRCQSTRIFPGTLLNSPLPGTNG